MTDNWSSNDRLLIAAIEQARARWATLRVAIVGLLIPLAVVALVPIASVLAGSPSDSPRGAPRSTVTAALSASLGIAFAIASVGSVALLRRRARRNRQGKLNIKPAISALRACDTQSFTSDELRRRSKLITEINKLAGAIEDIPISLRSRNLHVIRAAGERAAAVRSLQIRVASLTLDDQLTMSADLKAIKAAYDSGKWMTLPSVDIEDTPKVSLGAQIFWTSVAFVSFLGIVSMVVLTAVSVVPQSVGAPVPFVLGLLLYTAFSRLGISQDAMKNAVEANTKLLRGLGWAEEKKSSDNEGDVET